MFPKFQNCFEEDEIILGSYYLNTISKRKEGVNIYYI